MRAGKAKTFWLAFAITLAVLLPLIAALSIYGMVRSRGAKPVEQSRSDVAIRSPGAENVMNLLVVTAGEEPAFVLVRLDAMEGKINLACLPGQLNADKVPGGRTLASSYQAAGPARAAQMVEEMLGIQIQRYLAITPQNIGEAFGTVGTARVNLTTLMTEGERAAAGFGGPVQEFTPASAAVFLADQDLEALRMAQLRCAVWEAFLRQNLEMLPNAVPQGLRRVSSTLLTDLSALDLYTLADTLEFLADRGGVVEHTPVPAQWESRSGICVIGEDAPQWAAEQFGGAAPASRQEEWPKPTPSPTPTKTPPPAMAGGL